MPMRRSPTSSPIRRGSDSFTEVILQLPGRALRDDRTGNDPQKRDRIIKLEWIIQG